jgi:hypothetical protein
MAGVVAPPAKEECLAVAEASPRRDQAHRKEQQDGGVEDQRVALVRAVHQVAGDVQTRQYRPNPPNVVADLVRVQRRLRPGAGPDLVGSEKAVGVVEQELEE